MDFQMFKILVICSMLCGLLSAQESETDENNLSGNGTIVDDKTWIEDFETDSLDIEEWSMSPYNDGDKKLENGILSVNVTTWFAMYLGDVFEETKFDLSEIKMKIPETENCTFTIEITQEYKYDPPTSHKHTLSTPTQSRRFEIVIARKNSDLSITGNTSPPHKEWEQKTISGLDLENFLNYKIQTSYDNVKLYVDEEEAVNVAVDALLEDEEPLINPKLYSTRMNFYFFTWNSDLGVDNSAVYELDSVKVHKS